MKKQRTLLVFVAITTALGLAGCGGGGGGDNASDEFTVGATAPLTGPSAIYGKATREGFELAINEEMAGGTAEIAGKELKVKLEFVDSAGDPATGVTVARGLLDGGVDFMMGDLYSSSVSNAIMELAQSYPKTMMMSGFATADSIGDKIAESPDKYTNYWKGAFGTRGYAPSAVSLVQAAEEAAGITGKRVAVISEGTEFGVGIRDAMVKALKAADFEVVSQSTPEYGATDFGSALASIKSASPDAVVSTFTAPASGIAFAKQFEQQRLSALNVAVYYPSDPGFLKAVGPAANGTLWTALQYDPSIFENQREFAKKFADAQGGSATLNQALGYVVGKNVMDILRRSKSMDIADIVDAAASLDRDTILGRFHYNTERHEIVSGEDGVPFPGAQIQDGVSVVVLPESLANGTLSVE